MKLRIDKITVGNETMWGAYWEKDIGKDGAIVFAPTRRAAVAQLFKQSTLGELLDYRKALKGQALDK